MEKNKGKVKLNDELLDQVSGGGQIIEYNAYQCTNSDCMRIYGLPDGHELVCPNCGADLVPWVQ